MLRFFKIILLLLSVALLSFTACNDSNSNSDTGTLNVQLTDAPFPSDQVARAEVTINRIEARSADEEGEDAFKTLSTETQSFNLLELTNDIVAPLSSSEIETGLYNQIRLFVSEASITLQDGETFDLTVPGGAQSGIKVNVDPAIEVTGNVSAELLLDFDVAKSFVPRGIIGESSFNGFIFKPVIRAANLSTAGRITGNVTLVSSDGQVTPLDKAEVSVTQLDSVISTTFADQEGSFALIGLREGNYILSATKTNLSIATVENVSVTAGNETKQNIAVNSSTIIGEAPTVESISPTDNETAVERNKVIEITFNEAMDPETINGTNITVTQGTIAIPGSVSLDLSDSTTAAFTGDVTFDALSDFTVTVTTGVKSAKGISIASDNVFNFTTGGSETPLAAVDLGTSGNFVVLAKTAVNNSPTSAFTGDLGLSPAAESFYTGFSQTSATGFSTSDQVTGKMFAADMADPTPINLTTAVNDMNTAFNDAAGRVTPDFVELHTGNLGGKTLTPGLYKWSNTVLITGDVTISGDADDVWIFQIAENLTMSSAVNITLSGGAQAKNIFWQVSGEVTIGTNAHFEGIILSKTGITLNTDATFNGRILAQTAAIFDSNTVTEPQ